MLVRLVAPLSLKDVLHLSFYPVGAGIFAGAAFALVASAVVAALIAVGFIPDIKFDFSQWALGEGLSCNAFDRIVFDCLKERSLLYTIVVAGLGDGYTNLKFPFGYISYIRPTIRTIGNVRFGSLADISSELAMSALPLKADMLSVEIDVRFVP